MRDCSDGDTWAPSSVFLLLLVENEVCVKGKVPNKLCKCKDLAGSAQLSRLAVQCKLINLTVRPH